ncbi:hypothetical protein PI124_g24826 [Phytophthora idaei]|nr:hypothetical protein PI125_g27305 [Phytophthora idaei]KAG3109065.1 hypothetical protein PI126_g24888 [Phytophthora idaei]KAG3230075.1 hypothetical protein PI124_g24826 [Phytophthora idaei]
MNDASLERELVRARHVDLATMREKLDQIRTGLEMMMQVVELEFQVLIEEREEHSYGLSETVGDGTSGTTHAETLPFGMLKISMNKLIKHV